MSDVLAPPTPRPAPTPRAQPSARRTRTRERLMAAAVGVFAERGILGASVEEICEAAGFTRGAFYSNFADKDALVLALVEQNISTQYAAAQRATADLDRLPAGRTPAERVSHVLARYEAAGRSDRVSALCQQELLLHAARVPAVAGAYLQFVEACRTELHTLIEDAMRLSGLEFTVPFEAALELLMATHEHMHLTALFTGQLDSSLMHRLIMTMSRPRS